MEIASISFAIKVERIYLEPGGWGKDKRTFNIAMRRLYGYLVRRGFGYSDIADTLENMNIRLVHTYSDES